MRSRTLSALVSSVLGVTALAGGYAVINCVRHDREHADITGSVRRSAAGSFVRLADGFTHYEIAGPENARTVVLVHGFSVPYFLWDHTFDPLVKAGFRVLRYDLYGRGLSDRPRIGYDADLYDRQLSDLLDALGIRAPVEIVGASMGGEIVVTFAARHPERVRTITLFDPTYVTGEPMPWEVRLPVVGEYIACVAFVPSLPARQRDDFVHPERYPGYFAKYEEQMRYRGFQRAILSTVRDFFSRDARPDFRRVGASGKPVLLVWGEQDRDAPFETSKAVIGDIPQAEFHALEGEAHVAFYESPEIVNPMVARFLNRN